MTLKPPDFAWSKPLEASVSSVISWEPTERIKGSALPEAVIVRLTKLQGVVEEALSGEAVQQPSPVQARVSEPETLIARSLEAAQPPKVRVSEFELQAEIRLDQLQPGTAHALGMGFKSSLRIRAYRASSLFELRAITASPAEELPPMAAVATSEPVPSPLE